MTASIIRTVIFLYCVSVAWLACAESPMKDMVITMRDSGYTMGDTMQMAVTFSLPVQQTIDEESLPLVGRANPWLDIQAIKLKQHNQRVQLIIMWQLFATVEIAQQLKTPEIVLKTAEKKPQTIIIPAQAFYYSPVLPMPPLKGIERRPNLEPPNIDKYKPILYFSIFASLFVLCGLVWLWLKDYLPWAPFQPGPMTRLTRQLTKHPAGMSFIQLREIHTALNQSAGVSLYPENLSQLFRRAPYFSHEEANIRQFFNQSWSLFYADKPLTETTIDLKATLEWIQSVAIAERLFAQRLMREKSRD
ncbi:MAG: hypothetical protein ACSHWN_02480 [Methylophilaceae bacterium]